MTGYRAYSFELAVFLMDHHSGQNSKGYRLLCKLRPANFSSTFCQDCRETEVYSELVSKFAKSV
jgi:hypothetical protein